MDQVPMGFETCPPTHGPGSKAQWGPHKCTSWKWDGKCSGAKGKVSLRTTGGMFGSLIHSMAWAYSGKCWRKQECISCRERQQNI
eukprot:28665-Karenia_brevis.AAC.1